MTKNIAGTIDSPTTGSKQKSTLNREVLNNNFYYCKMLLENFGLKNDCKIVTINPKYTSITCSNCGHVHKDNRKTQAEFKCLNCNLELNADINAAINIKNKHLALAGEVLAETSSIDESMKREYLLNYNENSNDSSDISNVG